MILTLYHGSEYVIEHPELKKGKPHNDFGRGFYCTENMELAKEWACADNRDGFANSYEFEPEHLKILNLNAPEYNILNWLAILTRYRTYWQNGSIAEEAKDYLQRHFFVDPSEYDVINGYRADDSYFTFAQDFVAGTISLSKLSEAMRLGKLGEQIVLKSKQSFAHIRFLEAIPADAQTYFEKKSVRDRGARREYRRTKRAADGINELFMIDIMREGMRNGDPRLR